MKGIYADLTHFFNKHNNEEVNEGNSGNQAWGQNVCYVL